MRVVVCGGRTYTDRNRVFEALDAINRRCAIGLVIHGDCDDFEGKPTTDRLSGEWAKERHIPVIPMPANWDDLDAPGAKIRWNAKFRKFYNASAGPKRNGEMLSLLRRDDGDLVVQFPGGIGTANCVLQALRLSLAIVTVEE